MARVEGNFLWENSTFIMYSITWVLQTKNKSLQCWKIDFRYHWNDANRRSNWFARSHQRLCSTQWNPFAHVRMQFIKFSLVYYTIPSVNCSNSMECIKRKPSCFYGFVFVHSLTKQIIRILNATVKYMRIKIASFPDDCRCIFVYSFACTLKVATAISIASRI